MLKFYVLIHPFFTLTTWCFLAYLLDLIPTLQKGMGMQNFYLISFSDILSRFEICLMVFDSGCDVCNIVINCFHIAYSCTPKSNLSC